MTNLQVFLAVIAVVSAEIGVVLTFMLHGFSDTKQQINPLIQYAVNHEGRLSVVEDHTKGKS